MEIREIIEGWNRGDWKPMKGSLIDMDAYENGGGYCAMCAQGQLLHLLGGWSPKRLHDVEQAQADLDTAELLNISRAHAILLRNINDKIEGAPTIVITDPGRVLGDQWSKLLDFWWAFDQFDAGQWKKVAAARDAAGDAAGDAAWAAAWAAAGDAAGDAARDAARAAAGDAAWAAAWDAARDAAGEIQGYAILTERGKDVFFLPMFGWASLSDIPARPDGYGLGLVPTR